MNHNVASNEVLEMPSFMEFRLPLIVLAARVWRSNSLVSTTRTSKAMRLSATQAGMPVPHAGLTSLAGFAHIGTVPVLLILLLLLSLHPAIAQSTHPITGRKIAPVMSAAGADWLERPERESEEAPDQALDELRIRPGMTVADVGAGTGYLALRIARPVHPPRTVSPNHLHTHLLSTFPP